MADVKKSDFTTVESVSDNRYFSVFGQNTDEKISKPNLFKQIQEELYSPFIYPTVELLQAAELEADEDFPTYVRVEENQYKLYKITSLAAGADDITLNNGATATFQVEYRDIGFVVGPGSSVTGALAIFSDTSGSQLDDLVVPTATGLALITASETATKGYFSKDTDNTVDVLQAQPFFDEIKQSAASGYAGVIKKSTTSSVTTGTADDEAVTPLTLQALTATETRDGLIEIATKAEAIDGSDQFKAMTPYTTSEVLAARAAIVVETFADLATTPAPTPGMIVYIKQHTSGGVGGGYFQDTAGTITNNGGTLINNTVTAGRHWRRVNYNVVSPKMFGAIGDGVADDYAALQLYLYYCAVWTGYTYTNSSIGSDTYLGARYGSFEDAGVYAISQTLTIPSNYDNFDFCNSLLIPHPDFNLNNFALNITAWNSTFSRLKLAKFTNGINLENANLDIGRIKFNGLDASNISRLFLIECRSTLTTISDYRFDAVKIVAEITNGDRVVFNDGWLSAGVMSSAGDAHFIVNSANDAGLTLNDFFYVPKPQTAARTSIVKIAGTPARVSMVDCLCGGEPGQIPLVANYVTGAAGLTRGCHITIDNCIGFTTNSGSAGGSRPAVELYALPNSVVFQNFYGGSEETGAQGLVNYNPFVQSFAAAKAALGSARFQLLINGRTPANFVGLSNSTAAEIALYDKSSPEITRVLALAATNTTTQALFIQSDAGAAVLYKVSLWSVSNSASDRYSEYIVASTNPNSPSAGWTLTPIIEGASTVAGRLAIVSNNVVIRSNSVAASDILVVAQKLSNTRIS